MFEKSISNKIKNNSESFAIIILFTAKWVHAYLNIIQYMFNI
jgi:hypothetical protein